MNFFFTSIRQKEKFNNAIIFSFALLMSVLVLISSWHYGIGIVPDSINYFSAADSWQNSGSFIGFTGQPLALWPPLFPIVLSLFNLLGISYSLAALIINVVSAFFTIFFLGKILEYIDINRYLRIVFLFVMVMSGIFLSVMNIALTEALFIFLLTAFVYLLIRYVKEGKLKFFYLLIVVSGLSSVIRYLGVVMIISGAIIFLYNFKELNFQKKIYKAVKYIFFSSLPLLMWVIRNLVVTGTLAGERSFVKNSLIDQIFSFVDAITLWFTFSFFSAGIRIAILLLIISWLVYLILKKRSKFLLNSMARNIGILVIVYVLLIILLSTLGTGQLIDTRYLSPIYPFAFILLAYFIDKLYINYKNSVLILLTILIATSLVVQIIATVYIDNKLGVNTLSSDEWQKYYANSKTKQFNFSADKKIITNSPSSFYWESGKYSDYSAINGETLEELISRAGSDYYLVWYFGYLPHPDLHDFSWTYDRFNSKLLQVNESINSKLSSRIYYISGLK